MRPAKDLPRELLKSPGIRSHNVGEDDQLGDLRKNSDRYYLRQSEDGASRSGVIRYHLKGNRSRHKRDENKISKGTDVDLGSEVHRENRTSEKNEKEDVSEQEQGLIIRRVQVF